MKRLRFRFGAGIRFYHCGEYGEKFARPHYHACLFNFNFPDRKLWKTVGENRLYTSDALSELWPFGFSTIGAVTFDSAAYVARYITKKITGDRAESHYNGRKPEYTTMSRRPGIGKPWFDRYKGDVFPSDEVVIRGRAMRPPKYYDRLFELAYPSDFAKLKRLRKAEGIRLSVLHPEARLHIREKIAELRFRQLARKYESDDPQSVYGV